MSYINVSLPSRCIPYPDIDPKTIMIRPYNGGDEVFLSQINFSNIESKFLLVGERVLKGIDPKLLTLGDRLYLIIWLCVNSYIDVMTVSAVCPHCLREVDIPVNLRELETLEISEDFDPEKPIKLSDGTSLQVRLFNCEDMAEYENYMQSHDNGYLFKYARSIKTGEDILGRIEYLKKLASKDTALIRAYQEKHAHGPDLSASAECPSCGKENTFLVPFRLDFLFPTGTTLTSSFGKGI